MARAIRRAYAARSVQSDNERTINWSIVAFPNPGWAERVFGEPDVERLWDLVARAVRLDEPDPVDAWKEHVAMLRVRAEQLDERRFDAIRFRGPGTDLFVGLSPLSRWKGAVEETAYGLEHVVNLPDRGGVHDARPATDGRHASLHASGRAARERGRGTSSSTFRNGHVVDVRAKTGADDLRESFAFDDGASMLGEVAIVDSSSRVGQLGLVFFDTLFDENATSHVALGSAYLSALDGGTDSPRTSGRRPA